MLDGQGNKLNTSSITIPKLDPARVVKVMATVATTIATTMPMLMSMLVPMLMSMLVPVMMLVIVPLAINLTHPSTLYAQGGNAGYAINNSPGGGTAIHLSTILSSVYIVKEALACLSDAESDRVATVTVCNRKSTVWSSTSIGHIGIYAKLAAQQENLTHGDELPLISITQFDIALRVKNLKPSGIGRNFTIPSGEQSITLYAFSDIQTAIYPTNILHVWVYKGMVAAEIPLNVGSASWRTYSSKIIEGTERGGWSVYIYHIKDGGGAQDATMKSLFGFYTTDTRSLNNDGSILSQGANIVRNNAKTATLLGTYSFTVN